MVACACGRRESERSKCAIASWAFAHSPTTSIDISSGPARHCRSIESSSTRYSCKVVTHDNKRRERTMIVGIISPFLLLSSLVLAGQQQQIPFSVSSSNSKEQGLNTLAVVDTFPRIKSADGGLSHEVISSLDYPAHSIRINPVDSLCDSSVKSYSGYLDIANDKSLFFWMFESRGSPRKDPLALWFVGHILLSLPLSLCPLLPSLCMSTGC